MTPERSPLWDALLANRERALRVALARCGDRAEAEDCAQEAMARVAAMGDVDVRRVGALLTTVVANLAADGHRRRSRSSRLHQRLAGQRTVQTGPDERICDTAEARWLWSQRTGLAERDRQVLELRVQGRTLSEAAAELGVTYKAAENALGRARARMRAVWAGTAAVLGGVLAWRPRRQAGTILATPALALALALVLLPLHDPVPRPQLPPDGTSRAGAPPPAQAPASRTLPPRDAARPSTLSATAATPPPSGPTSGPATADAPAPRTVASTAAVAVGPLALTAASVDQQGEEDDALETLSQCIADGPVVSVSLGGSTLGCRE